ncbi:MAG: DUF3108 domain-containing protein [Alphaproteobacteria bacterium]|nr:DUF3108 domain-containing protein [Alphaproteobacteria bacterium]
MKKYLLLTLIFISTFTANAATVEQSFNVEIGVFDAANVNISYQLDEKAYSFSSQIQTDGMFDKFYSFKASYFTSGFIFKNRLSAQDYRQTTQSSAHKRTKRLIFNNNGILAKRISTKDNEKKEVNIVLPQRKIDAFDIQTALALLIRNFIDTQSCDLDQTIFNGKKIYHISIKGSKRTLLNDKKLPVKGEAFECHAFIHQENLDKGDLLWQVSSERSIKFYLMLDKASHLPFLAKMEIASTPLGKLEAYITDLTIKE